MLTVGSAAHLHPRLAHNLHTVVAGCAPSGLSEFMLPACVGHSGVMALLLSLQIIQ